MNKLAVTVLVFLTIVGCASKPRSMVYSSVSIPELNKITEKTLGEKLVEQGIGYSVDTITIQPLDAYAADFSGGLFFNIKGTDYYESDEKNTVTINNGYGFPYSTQNTIFYDRDDNEICTKKTMGNCYDSSEMSFEYNPKKIFKIKPNSFQQVIEYNGKSGDTLRFVYREYSNNLARQAFTTNFTMDLNEGNQIGYKGSLIEVIKATNSTIQYRVLKNFNK